MRTLPLALATAALLAAAAPASAADYTVTGGKLDWTITNYFASGDPDRTWLGYATNTVGGGAANGNVTSTAPATMRDKYGAAVTLIDSTSPRGLDKWYTLSYPVAGAGGTYSSVGKGAIDLTGKLTFVIHPGVIPPMTIVDPRITLDGLTGTLTATGTNSSGATYDRTATQFSLDLSAATVADRPDGSGKVIAGIVPVSTADTALAGFPPPSRRFGTMTLTLGLDAEDDETPQIGATGAPGPSGAAGPAGPSGKDGKDGRDAELRVVRLAKAPFATKREVQVRLLDGKTGKLVARGTVQGRTLRLSVLVGTNLAKGSYTLRRTATKASGKRQARVAIR